MSALAYIVVADFRQSCSMNVHYALSTLCLKTILALCVQIDGILSNRHFINVSVLHTDAAVFDRQSAEISSFDSEQSC